MNITPSAVPPTHVSQKMSEARPSCFPAKPSYRSVAYKTWMVGGARTMVNSRSDHTLNVVKPVNAACARRMVSDPRQRMAVYSTANQTVAATESLTNGYCSDCYSSQDYQKFQRDQDLKKRLQNNPLINIQRMLDSLNNNIDAYIEENLRNKQPEEPTVTFHIAGANSDYPDDVYRYLKRQMDIIRTKDFHILRELYKLQDSVNKIKGTSVAAWDDQLPDLPQCLQL